MRLLSTIACRMAKPLLTVLIGLLPIAAAWAQPAFTEERPPAMEELFEYDERFRYKISYGWFTVGWVDVRLRGDSLIDGRPAYLLETKVTSNSKLPLVGDEVAIFRSWMIQGDSTFYAHSFWMDNIDEGIYKEDYYRFDRTDSLVYLHHEDVPDDTLALEEPASAGHILFYMTRLYAGTNYRLDVPIYLEEGKGRAITNFTQRINRRSYEAFEDEITTYFAYGETTVTGPFGLNGDFKAWFGTGPLRIPLEAHLKVFLGNVKVRLIAYSRSEGLPTDWNRTEPTTEASEKSN